LGAKKDYPVYLDASAEQQEVIAISAGKRGEQIILKPADLITAAKATIAAVSR
jgi:Cys-tRNA(Pro)/Cys-tRNA(Cys) deacylase